MNSFILFSFFYLVNIGFKIKADDYNIRINCAQNEYFYSINYTCLRCAREKVYNNVCYLNYRSIYGKSISSFEECDEDEFLTELDEEGKHLGKLVCAKTKQNYNDDSSPSNNLGFSLYPYQDIKRPANGYSTSITFTLRGIDNAEINYAVNSCEKGLYEKSCQYLANLCALSMYDKQSFFCQKIFNFEKDNSM